MPVLVDDLVLYTQLLYSHRFLDLFESQITSQIKLIRSSQASVRSATMWSDEARQSLRYAFFLRYYASFESRLKFICDRFAEAESLPLRFSDINGKDFLNRVNKYLTRVVNCAPLGKHPLWDDARSYAWIRNTIIHNNGQAVDRGSIPQYVHRQLKQPSAGLTLSATGVIRMRRRFCYRAVRQMAQLLLDVYGMSPAGSGPQALKRGL